MPESDGERAAVLRFDEFDEGSTQLCLEVGVEELDLTDPYFSFPLPLAVDLEVFRSLETFTAEGVVRCVIRGECCRCLAPVEEEIEAGFRLLFQRKRATDAELEAVEEEEEIEIFEPNAESADLGSYLREIVIVELPMRLYCREDCKGLCPQCGRDLNTGSCSCREETVDPRWAALEKLRFSS